MMKFECFDTTIVAANLATTAFVFNSHLSHFFSAALNRFN
jgi:hypothetical protein